MGSSWRTSLMRAPQQFKFNRGSNEPKVNAGARSRHTRVAVPVLHDEARVVMIFDGPGRRKAARRALFAGRPNPLLPRALPLVPPGS